MNMRTAYVSIVLCIACAVDEPGDVSVSDSAGIRLVTLGSLASVPTQHVERDAVVRIGLIEGPPEYTFSNVVGGHFVGDMIVVADGSSNEIRQFNERGQLVKRAGARGEGPGEFTMLRWMKRTVDGSIATWDLRNRRVSHYTAELEYATAAVLNPSPPYLPLHVFADGSFLVWPFGGSGTPLTPNSTLHPMAYVAIGRLGQETLDTVAAVPARPSYVDRSGELWRLPFTVDPSFTASGFGHIWVGSGNNGELRRYSRAGRVEAVVRLPSGRLIEDSDVEAWLASDPEHAGTLRNVPVPDHLPSFSDLVSSSDGSIWVKEYSTARASTASWLVLDSSGLPLMRLTMPNGRLLDIRDSQLLLLERDSLGVERVASYRIPETAH